MLIRYVYDNVEYSLTANWNDESGASTIFSNITQQICIRHNLDISLYEQISKSFDGLVDKLYSQFFQFTNEHSGVPYNPKFRRTIIFAFSEITKAVENFQIQHNDQQELVFAYLYKNIIDNLRDVVNVYLNDFSYQSKFRERLKRKEQYIEVTQPLKLSYEFEDDLLKKIGIESILHCLTKSQRNRLVKHIVFKYTLQEIASIENVSWQSVQESINTSLKKLKVEIKIHRS
ncbi:MAG: hypothetical protein RR234_00460 [Christensenella sp.]